MDNFYGRSVFFVKEAEDALAFYTQKLGFNLDWNHQVEGRAFVFQVSLYGFELILNQIEDWTKDRAGHGRVFIGLDESQVASLREHIGPKGIKGRPLSLGEAYSCHQRPGRERIVLLATRK